MGVADGIFALKVAKIACRLARLARCTCVGSGVAARTIWVEVGTVAGVVMGSEVEMGADGDGDSEQAIRRPASKTSDATNVARVGTGTPL